MPMLVIALVLFVFGLMWGSFINALVWRLHEQSKKKKSSKNLSIISGRSMCVHCKHELAWYDLFPVASWLAQRGKCRYCRKNISPQYPIVELVTGVTFAASYLIWPHTIHLNGQWLLLAAWLVCAVGLLALAVYDLRWMLLPNRIVYPTLAAAAVGRAGYIIIFAKNKPHSLLLWALSLLIASGIFYVLYSINDKWIGFGDVRLGLITGTLLADPQKSLAMIFIASLLGSLIAAPDLIGGKKTMASRLPYGPFLIAATAVMALWGDSLLNWYKSLLI
jgi:prepilin signal peptidase PulO-like enzyme (type II secretory pathway)